MKLSVIIPSYQVEKFISCCLSSVVNSICQANLQNNTEIIIIDDGSIDKTGMICDQYASKYDMIRTIHQKNRGISGARNMGMLFASGEVISFVDSDDKVTPDFFYKMVLPIQAENADIVCCGMTILNTNIPYLSHPKQPQIYLREAGILTVLARDGVQDFLMNKVYKREVLDGIKFPEGRVYEDTFIQHHIFSKSEKTVFLNSSLYLYRFNESGITHNNQFKPNRMDFVWATQQQLEFTEKKYPSFLPLAIAKHLNAICQVSWYMWRNNYTSSRRKILNCLIAMANHYHEQLKTNPYLSPLLQLELCRLTEGYRTWSRYCKKAEYIKKLHNHPRVQRIFSRLFSIPLNLPRKENQY